MLNQDVVKYGFRSIVRYMSGDINEFERLVDMAIEYNKIEHRLLPCKYKVNGLWVSAKICFETGVIKALTEMS